MHLGRKHNNFSQSLLAHAVRGFKLEQHNRQYIQPRFHAAQYYSLYRALKKLNFRQLPLLGFSGTFDML